MLLSTKSRSIVRIGRSLRSCTVRCWSNPGPPYRRPYTSPGGTAVLSQTTSFLRNLDNGAEIFLVGTAHVSQRSAEEVSDLINLVKPDVVMIELCAKRAQRLRRGQSSDAEFLKEMLGQMFAPGTNFGQQLFKVSMQGMYRALHSIGMNVGGEFLAAIKAAEKHNAKLVYGDRDVQETLARLSSAVRLEDILKIVTQGGPPQAMIEFFEDQSTQEWSAKSIIEAQVEAMKTRRMARQMSDYMRQLNPALAVALIDERDEFMVNVLRGIKGRAVGVVGLAHLDGIERKWEALQGSAGVIAPPVPRLEK